MTIHSIFRNLLLCTLLSSATAETTDWKLARDHDGIQVYTREIEGIAFRQFKGAVTIEAPLSAVVAAFEDLDAAEKWVRSCKKMELLERVSPTETYVYSYSPAPWPIRDRDVVVRNTISQDPESLVVTIQQTAAPRKTMRLANTIRIELIEGCWKMTPRPDGKTDLEYSVLSDPGGGLPAWFVNRISISMPKDILSGMRNAACSAKHANARFDFITEPVQWKADSPQLTDDSAHFERVLPDFGSRSTLLQAGKPGI
ncbi:START domain-containing protein [Pontiellaceae bacterium B12227]|nr:START domain-containing protein [Pontiellaceae bacterium B12227]